VLAASVFVFIVYCLLFVAGEVLADRQLLSPVVAMWMANAILLAFALLIVRRPRRSDPTHGAETLAIGGG
jgi:lipopolysaccharide export LptBFGC system permease protein LptF